MIIFTLSITVIIGPYTSITNSALRFNYKIIRWTIRIRPCISSVGLLLNLWCISSRGKQKLKGSRGSTTYGHYVNLTNSEKSIALSKVLVNYRSAHCKWDCPFQ